MQIPLIPKLFKTRNQENNWVSVGLEKHGIFLAEINFSGAMPRVARCEYHETEMMTPASLDKFRRETGIGNRKVTTLLAPGEYQMLQVDAPNVPVDEMKTAVRWKIKDRLNYLIDDATVDMVKIPDSRSASGRSQSLYAIAAENGVIQKRISLFEQARIKLDVIDVPEMAQRNIAALFEQRDRALAMLSFDDAGGLMTFTAGGELYLARRIEISIGQLSDANENIRQQYLDRVETELRRSLDYFDRHFDQLPVETVLVNVTDNTGLVEFLSVALDVKVRKLELSQVLDISAVPALADSEFVTHSFLALGAALRQESRAL